MFNVDAQSHAVMERRASDGGVGGNLLVFADSAQAQSRIQGVVLCAVVELYSVENGIAVFVFGEGCSQI